jgi:hypothetical protein
MALVVMADGKRRFENRCTATADAASVTPQPCISGRPRLKKSSAVCGFAQQRRHEEAAAARGFVHRRKTRGPMLMP